MKTTLKRTVLMMGFILSLLAAHAQTVSIPDTLFGNWLNTHGYSQCLTGSAAAGWQLDTACNKLHNDTTLSITSTHIHNLEGIQYFVGLTQFSCYNDTLDSLPALPPNLLGLECGANLLTYLPPLPTGITVLYCYSNNLSALPTLPPNLRIMQCQQNLLTSLPTLPNSLYFFSCANNLLTSLPALPDSISNFYCDINQLTVLPSFPAKLIQLVCDKNQLTANSFPTTPSNVTYLSCDGNQLTTLPMATFPKLQVLYCSSNPLTGITGLPITLTDLICDFVPLDSANISLPANLTTLVMAFDNLTALPALPPHLTGIDCGNNLLTYLPVIPNTVNQLYCNDNQLTSINSLPDSLTVWFDCSYNPGLTCLPPIKKLHKFLFNNTGITCLSRYPQDCDTSSPNISTVPLCDAGNIHGCAISNCVPIFSSVTDSLCPGGDFIYYHYHHTSIGTYTDTLVSSLGCDSIVTLTLLAANVCPTSAGPSQHICVTDTLVMNASGKGYWTLNYFNPTDIHGHIRAIPVMQDNTSPTTKVWGFEPYGYVYTWHSEGYSTTMTVYVGTYCVWPGDADDNDLVDNNDLLPIGLAYDSTGSTRYAQNIVWQGDAAYRWTDSLANGYNYVHADCNGDGIINANDTLAIMQNFSLTHSKAANTTPAYRSGLSDLTVKLSPDTIYAGDTLTISLLLGDASNPANNIYGLAFTLNYDNLVTDSNSIGFGFGNSWFGNSTNSISIHKNDFSSGTIKAAITGIDHASRSGYGIIATMKSIITTDNINGKDFSYYTSKAFISNIKAIDAQGTVIQLNAGADSIQTAFVPTGINEVVKETINLKPNPAKDRMTISAANNIIDIEVLDVVGQKIIAPTTIAGKYATMNITSLSAGIYMVAVKTEKGAGIVKLVVTN